MPKYNLNSLGPENFELLSQDLIFEVIGKGARIYGMGKDGAREATYAGVAPYPSKIESWSGKWIFQAKFHDGTYLALGPFLGECFSQGLRQVSSL